MGDLYDRFGKLAFSVILSIVRDPATAEDLVQETFLRVWNRIQAFEAGRGALGPGFWRSRAPRDRSRSLYGLADGPNSFEFDAREHPSLFVDMERDVVNTDHARMIRQAIEKLNENQRKVIELATTRGFRRPRWRRRWDSRSER